MNRDRLEGHWKQTKGRARKSAGRWTGTPPTGTGPLERPPARDWPAADEGSPRPLRDLPAR